MNKEEHRQLCAYLDEAEEAFRKNPDAAYATCRALARKYGRPANSIELQAYDAAATDFAAGALNT